MCDFHELTGDLTREQLHNDPYWRGVDVGEAAREHYPRYWPRKLAGSVGIRSFSSWRESMAGSRFGDSGLTRDGVLIYGSDSHCFEIFIYTDLDCDMKERAAALLLGLALVSPHCGDRAGETVRSDCVSRMFAEGFADGFLRGDACDADELELALCLSADVRSRVKDALFSDGKVVSRSGGTDGGVSSDGLNLLVAGSVGSGKSVALVDDMPTGSQFARPDMVLSLNGRTVEVYNHDGAALSVDVGDGGVTLVNEDTGERVRVPESASHVFFVRDNFVILPPAGW